MTGTTPVIAHRAHNVVQRDESRSHLMMAILVFVIEVASIIQVEAWMFHILLASMVFGQEVVELIVTAVDGVIADL